MITDSQVEAGIFAPRASLFLTGLSLTNWLALLIAFLVGRTLYYAVFHPLARIPGPLSVRAGIPSLRFFASCCSRWPWELHNLHRQYGDVVRTGSNTVSVIDPDTVHAVYAHGNNYAKASFYNAFRPLKNKPSLFSDLDPHSHAMRRRTVAHVYTMKSLSALEDYIEPCVNGILKAFDTVIAGASGGQAHVEMQKWLHYFASDTVGELAFGRSFNLLAAGKDDAGFLPAVTNLSVYGSIAGTLPSLSPLIKKYLYSTTLFSPSIIGKLTWERVQDRLALMSSKEEVAARQDMLAGFMKSKYPGTEIPVEPPEVVALASSVISAGSDTTAIALDAFFYYILTNNSVYDRVQREVDAAYDAGVLRDGEPVRYAQGVKLEYLLACVKESMRLITPFVMDMLRVVPQGGLTAGKWFLPAGTEVGTNSYAFHRNKAAFGEDAEHFRPERWIGLSAEERGALERNFMSFGGGSRACIGRNISMMEIIKLLPTLLRRYHFSPTLRSSDSPHKYRHGCSPTGEASAAEPALFKASSFLEVHDFWCTVSLRPEVGLAILDQDDKP